MQIKIVCNLSVLTMGLDCRPHGENLPSPQGWYTASALQSLKGIALKDTGHSEHAPKPSCIANHVPAFGICFAGAFS